MPPMWYRRVGLAALIAVVTWAAAVSPALADRGRPDGAPPPMGWNGYNHYGRAVTAAIVEAEARDLVDSGMKAAGYTYVNLDGGWDLSYRGPDGELLPDPAKFPAGIAREAAYVHSLGLKFGIYTSAGYYNCAGTSAGSYGHYAQDAQTFAAWGVDYVKVDWCYVPYGLFPRLSRRQVSSLLAAKMGAALRSTGRPFLYDVNDARARDLPGTWAPASGGRMWRVAGDIGDGYPSMLRNFTRDVALSPAARPGGWNDPDMLEVGNGGMTPVEYQAMFSLWAELAAPLIAGNDLTQMSPSTRQILLNRAVIAVDQDPLGVQGFAVSDQLGLWVLTKPLAEGGRAVVLFNSTPRAAAITTTPAQVGLRTPAIYCLTDLWTGELTYTRGVIAAEVPAGGAVMYQVAQISAARSQLPHIPAGTSTSTPQRRRSE